MNNDFLYRLINWPKYFITGTDLRIVIPGTDDIRKAIVKRAVHEGYLERLKRDLYLIRNINNTALVNAFEIAQLVYGPSYISFESALSYYGWIPESVPVICSATVKQSKIFNTNFAAFSFEKIPNIAFSYGLTQIKDQNSKYLIADPWKAIADMIYLRKKKWRNLTELMEDLRIESDSILQSNTELLNVLSKVYPHKLVRQVLKNIAISIDNLKESNNET
jgi:predicted transcriptional regulator of viral defense system